MLLSLRVTQAKFASFAMDEVIPATVTCSLFTTLDFDSILVDVPVALTTLRTLRLPQILRGLHP
jgi:anion-transporting  ArsA/GET3 family ATPase